MPRGMSGLGIDWAISIDKLVLLYEQFDYNLIFFLCVGICRDCRTAIVPDTKITVTEACSSSLGGIAKGIENVSLVSHFSDST